jgi:hypothetical protein
VYCFAGYDSGLVLWLVGALTPPALSGTLPTEVERANINRFDCKPLTEPGNSYRNEAGLRRSPTESPLPVGEG